MKPELRKALEAELDHLNARIGAINLLLERSEKGAIAVPPKRETSLEAKKADGRSLRWKNATPEQRKAWANAIRTGRKRQKRKIK